MEDLNPKALSAEVIQQLLTNLSEDQLQAVSLSLRGIRTSCSPKDTEAGTSKPTHSKTNQSYAPSDDPTTAQAEMCQTHGGYELEEDDQVNDLLGGQAFTTVGQRRPNKRRSAIERSEITNEDSESEVRREPKKQKFGGLIQEKSRRLAERNQRQQTPTMNTTTPQNTNQPKNTKDQKIIYFNFINTKPSLSKFAQTLKKITNTTNPGSLRELTNSPGFSLKPLSKEISKLITPEEIKKNLPNFEIKMNINPTKKKPAPNFVIKNVPIEIDLETIKEELSEQNIKFKNLFRIKSQVYDSYTRLIRVFAENHETAEKAIKNGVIICLQHKPCEPGNEQANIIQCYKCQRYGHKISECNNAQQCPRCGGEHQLKDCQQDKKTPKCANCGGNHSAAYKGCKAYQEKATEKRKQTYADMLKKQTEKENQIKAEKEKITNLEKEVQEVQKRSEQYSEKIEDIDELYKKINYSILDVKDSNTKNFEEIKMEFGYMKDEIRETKEVTMKAQAQIEKLENRVNILEKQVKDINGIEMVTKIASIIGYVMEDICRTKMNKPDSLGQITIKTNEAMRALFPVGNVGPKTLEKIINEIKSKIHNERRQSNSQPLPGNR